MRLKLDDNERGAFHYLALGVAVVAGVRLLAWAFSFIGPALSPDMETLSAFQQEYPLLRGRFAVVGTGTGLTERMMQAVVLAVGLAVVSAIIQAIPAWKHRRLPGRAGTLFTRGLLIVALAWGTWSALFLPLRRSEVVQGRLLVTERPRAFGEIPWPVAAETQELAASDVSRLESVRTAANVGCDGLETLVAVTRKDTLELARRAGICPERELQGMREASAAAALLERELHTDR